MGSINDPDIQQVFSNPKVRREVFDKTVMRCFLWHFTHNFRIYANCFAWTQMMAAFQDIMTNPANMVKYKDDPEISEAFSKLTRKFGGGMAGGGFPAGGFPGGGFNVPQ